MTSIVYTTPSDGRPSREPARVKRLRREAFERQGGLCHWCKQPMIYKTEENSAEVWDHPRVCTADHLLWKAHGGKSTRDNIVAACRECNNARHPEPRGEVVSYLDWPWLYRLISHCRYNSEGCADFFPFPNTKESSR